MRKEKPCDIGSTTAWIVESIYARLEKTSEPGIICNSEELVRTWLKWPQHQQKEELFDYVNGDGVDATIDRLSKVVWLLATSRSRLSPLLCVFAAGLQVYTAAWRTSVADNFKHPDGAGRHVRETLQLLEAGDTNLAVTLKCEAAKYGFAPDYFGYVFQNVTGVGFHQFMHSLRTVRMSFLLHNTDLPVKDIIQRLGDWPIRSVIRQFHLQVGTTPGRFRVLSHGSACSRND